MAGLKIIVDSAADIPKELLEKYNITVFDILSIFGDDVYRPGVDLSNREFYRLLRESGTFPTTAQTPYAQMQEDIEKFLTEYDDVLVFTLSSKGSGQFSSLNMIKNELGGAPHLHIIDSMTFTVGIGMGAVYAAELYETEKDINALIDRTIEYMRGWDVYFVLDTLSYLEKGGRINKASAIIGQLLDIKPVLSVRGGLVEAVDKFRGKKNIAGKLIKKIKESPDFNPDDRRFAIVWADNEDMGREMLDAVKSEFEDAQIVMYSELGPIIGTHTGPNMVGVFFRKKSIQEGIVS